MPNSFVFNLANLFFYNQLYFILSEIESLVDPTNHQDQENNLKTKLGILEKEILQYKTKFGSLEEEMSSSDESFCNQEGSEDSENDREIQENKIKRNASRRFSVTSECFGKFNKLVEFYPRRIAKTQKDYEDIQKSLSNCFIFSEISDEGIKVISDAMEILQIDRNSVFISEGEQHDALFLVASGELEAYSNTNGKNNFVKNLIEGDTFNEIGILHKRASSITVKTMSKAIVYSLDSRSFKHAVISEAKAKQTKKEEILKKVEIFSVLTETEIKLIAESAELVKFKENEMILNDDENQVLLIISEGGVSYDDLNFCEGQELLVENFVKKSKVKAKIEAQVYM